MCSDHQRFSAGFSVGSLSDSAYPLHEALFDAGLKYPPPA
jgi:hypothetical protein